MGEGETSDRGLPRRRRHPLDPGRGAGARAPSVEGAGRASGIEPRDLRIRGVGLRGAAPAPRSTSATPAPCCGCCRAGSPGSRAAAGRSTATTRSGAGRSTGSPSRCARWAPSSRCREERLPPLEVDGAPLHGHRLRAAGRQRPGQVLPALRRPARRGRDPRGRAAAEPRPHRAHARRRRRRGRRRDGRRRRRSRPPSGSSRARSSSPPTSPRPPSSSSRRCSSPAARSRSTASASTRPAPAC